MKAVRLTPRAVADLAEIRLYTRRIWGTAQARAYLSGLGGCFRTIASGEARTYPTDVRNYRRCRYRSHYIIFVDDPEAVRIVRVLHERMDIVARLDRDDV